MGLQTHIGPQLLGTVKNNNPGLVTSANPIAGGLGASTGTVASGILTAGVPTGTVWPPFLGTGTTNGIRNLGVGDGTQFGSFVITSQAGTNPSFPTNQTGVTIPFQSNTSSSLSAATTYAFYPGVYTTGPTGQQQFQPIVIPAGSYISAIVFDITSVLTNQGITTNTGTAFSAGSTSQATLGFYAVGAPGTTFATPVNIVNHSGVGTTAGTTPPFTPSVTGAWSTAQRNQVGSGSGLSIPTGATPVSYLANTGNTDTILMCVLSLSLSNGTTGIGLGGVAGYIGINYAIRNPDGSWYPQSPTSPIANPPVVTY
jgi:hypothetical protein